MVFNCKKCSATFPHRGNQPRHEPSYQPEKVCLQHLPVVFLHALHKHSELEKHMNTYHRKFTNCGRSCYLGFNNTRLFSQHMSTLHSLPVFGDQFQSTQKPAETGFIVTPQSYCVQSSATQNNTDLVEFMLQLKPQIVSLNITKTLTRITKISI